MYVDNDFRRKTIQIYLCLKKKYPILLKRNQTNQFGHLFKTKIQKPQFLHVYKVSNIRNCV